MAKLKKSWLYAGVGIIAVVAWIATSPQDPVGSGGTKLRRNETTKKAPQLQFTEEDLTASYPELNESARNAFNPLVARQEQGTGGTLAPNEIPASYTGGEAGWMYTGTMIVDDVPSVLLENQLSGDVLYLMVGQNVKRAVISQITPTYIVVRGAGGQSLRLDLLIDRPEEGEEYSDMGFQPARPEVPGALSGPIRSGSSMGANSLQLSEQ